MKQKIRSVLKIKEKSGYYQIILDDEILESALKKKTPEIGDTVYVRSRATGTYRGISVLSYFDDGKSSKTENRDSSKIGDAEEVSDYLKQKVENSGKEVIG